MGSVPDRYRELRSRLRGDDAGAHQVRAATVQASLLDALSARPALGRLIREADDDPGAGWILVLGRRSISGLPCSWIRRSRPRTPTGCRRWGAWPRG